MFPFLYIEQEIANHPKVLEIKKRFPEATPLECMHYGEVFNVKAQNFRLQKENPSLILARKKGRFLHPIPASYGIGGKHNFYFSHMLNCLYDCRYCFLQGMYSSAHYVLFVNYEEYIQAIKEKIQEIPSHEPVYFFSGYDCDSLAMDQITGFIDAFLPVFANKTHAFLELRTKSINIQPLLKRPPTPNCIVAFSVTPSLLSKALEHKTPSLEKRLQAMHRLQEAGWSIGLRFDPLLYCDGYEKLYEELFHQVFTAIDATKIHSVSFGALRFPKNIFKKIHALHPEEKLFAFSFDSARPTVSYGESIENRMLNWYQKTLLSYVKEEVLFPCHANIT